MENNISVKTDNKYEADCIINSNSKLRVVTENRYKVECWKPGACFKNGKVKKSALKNPENYLRWVEEFDNIVVTAGLNKYLDATLKTGLAAPLWYVGLKSTGAPVAGDTMASKTNWSEIVPYSNATRPQWVSGAIAAGSVDNSASKASFAINSGTTVYGAFLADLNDKSGITGTLLGAGDFGTPRVVLSGDTLNVTVTCTQTAA
jgi:hypothetical protein